MQNIEIINQSRIPRRFQTSQTSQDDMQLEAMFEQQQQERQWLASSITKQRRQEGQEIDWERLSDNASEERIGWSFLQDVQNKFSVDGKWWLLRRISQERALQEEWFNENMDEHNHPYRIEAVVEYQRRVEAFQEKILLIMHMVGDSQPEPAS